MKNLNLQKLVLIGIGIAFALAGIGFLLYRYAPWILEYVAAYWVYTVVVLGIVVFVFYGGYKAISEEIRKRKAAKK